MGLPKRAFIIRNQLRQSEVLDEASGGPIMHFLPIKISVVCANDHLHQGTSK